MSIYETTCCPHCGASIEAFHGTNWVNWESRAGADRDHCPSCKLPYDLQRLEWQEWSSSGRWKSQLRAVFGLVTSAVAVILFVAVASGFLLPKGLWGIPREICGLTLLVLLPGVGLFVSLRSLAGRRGERFHPLTAEEKWRAEPEVPRWDSGPPAEGTLGMPSRSRGGRALESVPAPAPLAELAGRIASAFLRPGADPNVMARLRVLSESTCQLSPMRPAEADRKLGKLTMTGNDGTRAYVTIREDGRGHLSLLKPDGLERVVRFAYAIKRRCRPPIGSEGPHIRKSSPR